MLFDTEITESSLKVYLDGDWMKCPLNLLDYTRDPIGKVLKLNNIEFNVYEELDDSQKWLYDLTNDQVKRYLKSKESFYEQTLDGLEELLEIRL